MQIIIDTESRNDGSWTNLQIGYLIFRVFVGTNLFFHGFTRVLAGVAAWAGPEAATFADTIIPMPLVNLTLYTLPYVQIVLGACIAIGMFTRVVLLGGLAMFFVLLIGHLTRQNWSGAHIVMHYGLYYWILLALLRQNRVAVDRLRAAGA